MDRPRNDDDYNADVDGRPPVGRDDEDPLLARLQAKHPNRNYGSVIDAPRPCPNPGVPDDVSSSD